MIRLALILAIAALLAGCDVGSCTNDTDHELRVQLFRECMAALPVGPQSTTYNDWAEVVAECNSVSVQQSWRRVCNGEVQNQTRQSRKPQPPEAT